MGGVWRACVGCIGVDERPPHQHYGDDHIGGESPPRFEMCGRGECESERGSLSVVFEMCGRGEGGLECGGCVRDGSHHESDGDDAFGLTAA